MSRFRATVALMMAIGCTGASDRDGIQVPVQDWPDCSKRSRGAVGIVDCSSNMTTGSKWTTSTVITKIRAMLTCKRSMDTAMMRKRENTKSISRQVCVTSIEILRSGVRGNHHAPIWSSGRRSDPSVDCNHPVEVALALRTDDRLMVDSQADTDRLEEL